MAYAFDKITNLVGEEDSGTDIFGGEVQTNQTEQPAPTGSTVMAPKTTTEGDIGETPEGSGSTSGGTTSSGSPDATDRSAILKANVGKTETPEAFQGIQSRVQQNTQALQDKADEYTQSYKDQYQFDVENQALDQAVQSGYGSDQYRDVSTMLQRQDPGAAQEFEGAEDLRVGDTRYLGTDAGLQHLAARGQDPQYTQGMGAFDVMLMQRDPNFQNMINQIRGENAVLERQIGEQPDLLEQQAYDYGKESLTGAQESARGYLGDYRQRLEAENTAEAEAYQQELENLDREAIGQEQVGEVTSEVENYLKTLYGGDRYKSQLEQVLGEYDPQKFIQFDEGNYGYQDFLDSGEANQLTNLGGLLGTGEAFTESLGPREQFQVNQAGMYDSISSAVQAARAERDTEQRAALQKMLDAAEGRATAEDERLSGLRGSYQDDLKRAAEEIAFKNRYRGVTAGDVEGFSQIDPMAANPDLFGKDYGATDMLTQEEVDQLNAINRDLGITEDYKVGAGGGQSFVDYGALEEYLLRQASDRNAGSRADQEAKDAAAAAAAEQEREANMSWLQRQRAKGMMGG